MNEKPAFKSIVGEHTFFDDAHVAYARQSSQGSNYSVAKEALAHFIHWYDMPWELRFCTVPKCLICF